MVLLMVLVPGGDSDNGEDGGPAEGVCGYRYMYTCMCVCVCHGFLHVCSMCTCAHMFVSACVMCLHLGVTHVCVLTDVPVCECAVMYVIVCLHVCISIMSVCI